MTWLRLLCCLSSGYVVNPDDYVSGLSPSYQGLMIFFPSPFPSLSVTGRDSLIRQVAFPLSPKLNCMHRDMTKVSFCRGAK